MEYEVQYTKDVRFTFTGFNGKGKRFIHLHLPEGNYSPVRHENHKWYHKMFNIAPKPVHVEGRVEIHKLPADVTNFGLYEAKKLYRSIGLNDATHLAADAVLATLKEYQKEIMAEFKASTFPSPIGYGNRGLNQLFEHIPNYDPNQEFTHPVTGDKVDLIFAVISLNDKHGWSREQIADWVETLDVDLTIKDSDE